MIPPIISTVEITDLPKDRRRPDTDLAYIKSSGAALRLRVLRRAGPLPGQSIAYFGPDIRISVPQPALNVNMDAHTNVESLSFSLDGLAEEDAHIHDPRSGHQQDSDPDSGPEHQRLQAAARARGRRRRPRSSSPTTWRS